jgi:hypothetical protein
MNDRTRRAAAQDDHARDLPDTTTLLDTAATGRPVEEVTALVSLLKETGGAAGAGHRALRAADVARPVGGVRRMAALLGESPDDGGETEVTLRAAALGRPIEDVAPLAGILVDPGPDTEPAPGPPLAAETPRPSAYAAHPGWGEPADVRPGTPATPAVRAARAPAVPEFPLPGRPARLGPPAVAAARAGSGALRHRLRRPVALALLLCGALHLPADPVLLFAGDPAALTALAVTAVCPTLGGVLALRDTAGAWRVAAVAGLAVVVLHVVSGITGFNPLDSALGGPLEWAGPAAVVCAAVGAVLAGLALQYRPPRAEPTE